MTGPHQATAILVAAAGLIALAFALMCLDRFLTRRQPQDLAWAVAMVLFAVGSLAMWLGESIGWNALTFRVFFLTGAVLNVAWLALGTVYLLAGRRIGDVSRFWLVGISCFASGVVLVAPLKSTVSGHELPTGREVFGGFSRALAAVGSGIPALVIIIGAVWSAWRIARGRRATLTSRASRNISSPRRLVGGNVLIAVGTLVLSGSGSLAGRFGKDQAFAVTLLAGVTVLFLGFLVASNAVTRHRRTSALALTGEMTG
jgi:hypothetical protein